MEFFDQEVEALITAHSGDEDNSGSRYSHGSKQIRDRLSAIANLCARRFPGDFVEIGCYVGKTTGRLAEVARKHNRRVIAVDPWKKGTQNCRGGEHKKFIKHTKPYEDIIDVVINRSQSREAIEYVKDRELCFAFVDGLHTYNGVKSDLETVSHCNGVIAVDDLGWSEEIRRAFREFRAQRKITNDRIREGYIIP